MKNSNLDLLIIGHAIQDTVFDENLEPNVSWGGIYNIARSFKNISKNFHKQQLNYEIEPSVYGEALIKINRTTSSKEIIHVNLNKFYRKPVLKNAKWYHFSYLNEAEIPKGFNKLQGVKSADLCRGKKIKNTHIFDYIFLSEEEHDAKKMSTKINKTIFISHSPSKICMWKNGKKKYEFNISDKLNNINCLGAGDHFAASFIYSKLEYNNDDKDCIIYAAKSCFEYLLLK